MVAVGRLRLRTVVTAGDGVPLLLINGVGANLELMQPLAEALGRGPGRPIPTIRFDVPGVGGSPGAFWLPRLRTLASSVAKLLDELLVAQVDVFGISWGGGLAQEFARRHPTRTRRLILASTSAGMISVPARPSVLLKLASPARYISPGRMDAVADVLYGSGVRDAIGFHDHLRRLRAPTAKGYVDQLVMTIGWTSLPWLHKVQAPALVLHGDRDVIVPMVNARLVAGRLANGQLQVINGGGHLFVITHREQAIGAIRRHIDATEQDVPSGA